MYLFLTSEVIVAYFKKKPPYSTVYTELHFDKMLARCSLFVDASANALIVLTPASSSVIFIALSCLSSFTSGGNPSLHSLGAVCLHASGRSSEVGTLFGAFAFLSATAHIISVSRIVVLSDLALNESFQPSLYAGLYGLSVKAFPKAIFCLAATLLMTAVVLLGSLRSADTSVAYVPVDEEEADTEDVT
jgi:hypothetical protein